MSLDENRDNTVSAAQPSGFRPGDVDLREYVVTHIDEAVEKGWVRPYYQPVVRTLTGMANAAAYAIDTMKIEEIIGTLAGDDTILIILRDNEQANRFCKIAEDMLQ